MGWDQRAWDYAYSCQSRYDFRAEHVGAEQRRAKRFGAKRLGAQLFCWAKRAAEGDADTRSVQIPWWYAREAPPEEASQETQTRGAAVTALLPWISCTDSRYGLLLILLKKNGRFMQLTTTPSIEGKRITKYCGVIAGEAILGANLFKDLFAGIRDLVGGRSSTYEKELQRAREIALDELQRRAQDLGANAVIGIDIDYEIMGKENGMLMVSASGTAVIVE
jgi:uncharacterized protein YbjQ (UPF0145 family)